MLSGSNKSLQTYSRQLKLYRYFEMGRHCLRATLTFARINWSKQTICRQFCTEKRRLVLGIESSCDETGAAVVDNHGQVLGEALHSQKQIHIDNGGIIPPVARDLHKRYIAEVVRTALHEANVTLQDLDAIATTVKPGLAICLVVGMNYGKQLAREASKPFIPIHHMEAHALTVRMLEKIRFPFLTLLVSGGHCLLSVVQSVDKFLLLGRTIDDAPGEAFDKTARRLKLKNLSEYSTKGGGESIELLARTGNPLAFPFPVPMLQYRNCNFSFAGLKNSVRKCIVSEEARQGVEGGNLLPNVSDVCASFQWTLTRHILQRVHRATIFAEREELIPDDNRVLVVSGGVAANAFIRKAITKYCQELSYTVVFPPPQLCSDNGIMIAWNGMERLMANVGITEDLDSVDIQAECPLGKDISLDVFGNYIKLPKLKFGIDDIQS